MLDNKKIADFIAYKRKQIGMTQAEVAEQLSVSFQAVSKWENGTLPNVEVLSGLAELLHITVDEILSGREKSEDNRVLNGVGAFASLYNINFPDIEEPVLVLKSEEPGSKQKLAMEYGYSESICHDMINHLVNDIAVMGAKPLAVLQELSPERT